MVLIRKPLDAAMSWAIYQNLSLEASIVYWNDYYEILLPVRSELFLVRFTEVTTDFGRVIKAFNARWNTSYVPFDHTPENTAQCFQILENKHRGPSGEILEMRVTRPSQERSMVKEARLAQLTQSKFLQDELARAQELYDTFTKPISSPSRSVP